MQKTKWFRAYALASCVFMFIHAKAQVTEDNNNPTFGSYVGHVGTNTNPVEVRHNGNQPIQWFTDSIQRMWLTPTLTALTVNGYTGLDLSGRLGIGHFNSPVDQPLTLLHLDSMGTEVAGYRPWMGTGVLMTKTSDMMYVGMMGGDEDRSDSSGGDERCAIHLVGPSKRVR